MTVRTKYLTEREEEWLEKRLRRIREWEEKTHYRDFIDDNKIWSLLEETKNPDPKEVHEIIEKAKSNYRTGDLLPVEDVAKLINTTDPELLEEMFEAAYWIKVNVYGNRIVLFAPLYVSTPCVNNCVYCGFRRSNPAVFKKTLTPDEIESEVRALLRKGQKRLIVVYGEHPDSDHEYIARSIEHIYSIREGKSNIRRVNVNAPPMFVEEYEEIKSVGIGTYQVFQETYHHETYAKLHPADTLKGEYLWRLFALHRAFEAGIDDIAIGALFGLYDWRFDLLALQFHAKSLEEHFGVGPHTISYPRLEPAVNTPYSVNSPYKTTDEEFKRIVAIIRLMCPYTGSILTAREKPELRMEVMRKGGVSQMDAGTRIDVLGYTKAEKEEEEQAVDTQQFVINDPRSLDEFIYDIMKEGYLPSFCTACYRSARTGTNFMPLPKHGIIKNFCIPNGLLTLEEYLQDYASERVKELAEREIKPRYLQWCKEHLPEGAYNKLVEMLKEIDEGKRDLHF